MTVITHEEVVAALRAVPVGGTMSLYGQSVYRVSLTQWSVELSDDLRLFCAVDRLMARFRPVKGVARADLAPTAAPSLCPLADPPPSYHYRRAAVGAGRAAAPKAQAAAARPARADRGRRLGD